MSANEITTAEYWDDRWDGLPLANYDIEDHYFSSYRKIFLEVLSKVGKNDSVRPSIIDVGCGHGVMLRFFKEQFDVDVTGIDYAEVYRQARAMGEQLNLAFKVFKYDLLDESPSMDLGEFDIVSSFGLVEHFKDPFIPLQKMYAMVAEGGAFVTMIPNFHGLFNRLWKFYDHKNYSYHIPITAQQLAEMYHQLGLADVEILTVGRRMIPGLHDKDNVWRQLLSRLIINFNGRILSHLPAPKRAISGTLVPMVPAICAVGYRA